MKRMMLVGMRDIACQRLDAEPSAGGAEQPGVSGRTTPLPPRRSTRLADSIGAGRADHLFRVLDGTPGPRLGHPKAGMTTR